RARQAARAAPGFAGRRAADAHRGTSAAIAGIDGRGIQSPNQNDAPTTEKRPTYYAPAHTRDNDQRPVWRSRQGSRSWLVARTGNWHASPFPMRRDLPLSGLAMLAIFVAWLQKGLVQPISLSKC